MRCTHCMKELNQKAKFCPYCGSKPQEANPPHHLKAGTVLHNKYLIGSAIGEGGFGITYVGFDQTLELKVAVKEYFPSGCANRNNTFSNSVTLNYAAQSSCFSHGKESFLREAKSIAKFSQERGIVDVREYFTENNTAYIVMGFLEGVNLGKYVRTHGAFEPEKLFRLFLPLMRSLEKMHAAGVIHRDISPDNIMILNGENLTLTDFGAARYFSNDDDNSLSVVLKPGYAPYEQYTRKGRQGPWTDVYALCATAYFCITGITPPDSLGRSLEDDLRKPSDSGVAISPPLERVLLSGLKLRRQERLQNMGELITAVKSALSAEEVPAPEPRHDEPPLSPASDNRTRVAVDTSALTRHIPTNIPTYGEGNLYRDEPVVTDRRSAKPNSRKKTVILLILVLSVIALVAGAIVISVALSGQKSTRAKGGALKDDALAFTAAQSGDLRQKLDDASRETGLQVIVHTSKDGVSAENAAEHYNRYYSAHSFDEDAVMLAIDNASGEHVILSYGKAMQTFQNGSENYQALIAAVKPYLDNGEIYEASAAFIRQVVAVRRAETSSSNALTTSSLVP